MQTATISSFNKLWKIDYFFPTQKLAAEGFGQFVTSCRSFAQLLPQAFRQQLQGYHRRGFRSREIRHPWRAFPLANVIKLTSIFGDAKCLQGS